MALFVYTTLFINMTKAKQLHVGLKQSARSSNENGEITVTHESKLRNKQLIHNMHRQLIITAIRNPSLIYNFHSLV